MAAVLSAQAQAANDLATQAQRHAAAGINALYSSTRGLGKLLDGRPLVLHNLLYLTRALFFSQRNNLRCSNMAVG
jgi:hypothetical protein